MEKLAMCRICLVEDVRMYVVVNKNLHELYEKLTDVPFVTEDRRPQLACYFCCTKLKQCYRFLRKCLEAEELFACMLNGDIKQNPLINPGHLKFFNGFSNSPIELISIVDGGQTESDVIKEELPDVSERLDDIDVPEEEHQTDSASVAKKPKLDTREPNPSETILAAQKKIENNPEISCVSKMVKIENYDVSKLIMNTPKLIMNYHTSKRMAKFKEPVTKTQHGVNSRVNNIALGPSSPNNNDKDYIKCKISKKGVDSVEINRYRREIVTEKRFECDICQHSFSKKSDLTRHTRTHTGEKPYKCDICQRSFNLKYHLTIHTRIHTGEKPYKCEICQRNFRHKNYLKSHTRTHTGEKPFKCDICNTSFNQKIHLTTHIRTHTGEKPFKCDRCQRNFIKKGDLVCHIRTHTGEKPFKCDICQRSFTKKRDFVCHTRTHAVENTFKCVICQCSFTNKSDLVEHILTHSQEKPFKCDIVMST